MQTIKFSQQGRLFIPRLTIFVWAILQVSGAYAQFAGQIDTVFQNNIDEGISLSGNQVFAVAVQEDGKILIGGNFDSFNGTSIPGERIILMRLMPNGEVDTSFKIASSPFTDNFVSSIIETDENTILVGGSFDPLATSLGKQNIALLSSDGTVDQSAFTAGANALVKVFRKQADGRILAGGSFNNVIGATRNHILRLNVSGKTIDGSFFVGSGFNNDVEDIFVQEDGKILVVGSFGNYQGVEVPSIARLNTDGTRDIDFDPGEGPDNACFAVAQDGNGNIWVGGTFLAWDSQSRTGITRLGSNGTLSIGAIDEFKLSNIPNSLSLLVDPSGNMYAGGDINGYTDSNMEVFDVTSDLIRFSPEGQHLDLISGPTGMVNDMLLQSDAKLLMVGDFDNPGNRIGRLFALSNDDAPVALTAAEVGNTSFVARWSILPGVLGYQLDVSQDNFQTFLNGFESLSLDTTAIQIGGLQAGQDYQYRVRAVQTGNIISLNSNVVAVTTAPNAPLQLQISNERTDGFFLDWEAVPGATAYEVDVSTQIDFASFVAGFNALAISDSQLQVNGLAPNTQYFVRIRSQNNTGLSANSNVVSLVTLSNNPPGNVMNLIGRAISPSEVILSWEDVADEIGYKIQRTLVGDTGFVEVATAGLNSTSFIISGLNPETSYSFRVQAFNIGVLGALSNVVTVQTNPLPLGVPVFPVNLNLSVVSETRIDLGWSDFSQNETGFEIQRSLDTGRTYQDLAFLPANITFYSDRSLEPGRLYYYKVQAVNENGASGYSNFVSGRTPSFPPPLASPSNLRALAVSETEIDLQWRVNSSTEIGFSIERSQGSDTAFVEVGTVSQNVNTYQDRGLLPETTYFYRVRAFRPSAEFSGYTNVSGAVTFFGNIITSQSPELDGPWKIYPNPLGDELVLAHPQSKPTEYWLNLLNVQGELVYRELLRYQEGKKAWKVPTQNLPTGVYYLQISNQDEHFVYQLVKQ